MLVLTRVPGESIIVVSPRESCLVTVFKLFPKDPAVKVLAVRTSAEEPGKFECDMVSIGLNETYKFSDDTDVTLMDLRAEKVRLGINASRDSVVHKLEVYQAIHRKKPPGSDPGRGPAGSGVPRPGAPKPPSLDVRLDEPRNSDEGIN